MCRTEAAPLSEFILHWHDEFLLGIPLIDEEHKRLLRLVAFLSSALALKNHAEVVRAILLDIATFAHVHFSHEESMMESLRYPDLASHRAEHEDFRKRIAAFLDPAEDDSAFGMRVLNMMQEWLKHHLLELDKKFGEFVRKGKVSGAEP